MAADRSSLSTTSLSSSTASSLGGPTLKKATLVITGGSGWLGSTIAKVAYKHWEDLAEIRLFDCCPPDREVISSITGFSPPRGKPKVSYFHGNVLDEDALMACFAKADAVIHCAAVVESGSVLARRRMKQVNVNGTHRVVQACLECGVRALIFTGSLTQVMGSSNALNPVRFDESYQPSGRHQLAFPHYGGSKNAAENLVLLANEQEGKEGIALRTCSLRCPPMYGEGDTLFVPGVLAFARQCFGYFVPLGLWGNSGVTMQALYIGNGAWAHVLAAKKLLASSGDAVGGNDGSRDSAVDLSSDHDASGDADIGGNMYYVGDHTPICSFSNFYAQFLRPLGYRVLPIGIPFFLVRFLIFLLDFLLILLAIVRVDVAIPLNRGTLKCLRTSHSVSWEKARRELDYAPLYSHKTALAQSMEFYRKVAS